MNWQLEKVSDTQKRLELTNMMCLPLSPTFYIFQSKYEKSCYTSGEFCLLLEYKKDKLRVHNRIYIGIV